MITNSISRCPNISWGEKSPPVESHCARVTRMKDLFEGLKMKGKGNQPGNDFVEGFPGRVEQ